MSRAKHLAIIAAAFDRAAASPDRSVTALIGSLIIEHGDFAERFLRGNWTAERIREAVLGYAKAAPPIELSSMAYYADKQIHWIEWWDLAGSDECHLSPSTEVLLLPERKARRAAAAEARS